MLRLALSGLLSLGGYINVALAEHRDIRLANTRFLNPEETLLINALHNWEDGNPSLAITAIDSLLILAPRFKLAKSLKQTIQAQPAIQGQSAYQAFMSQPVNNAVKAEFEQRWNYFLSPAIDNKVPASLIRLSSQQKYAVVANLSQNRIYLFENQDHKPQLIADLYAGMGSKGAGKQKRGDKKTPVGVYFITSQLADNELDELYGIGAFPLSYPNALDIERGRTGDGIWIHGVPRSTWTRAPLSSRGCVTVANRNFERLASHIKADKTPVILSEALTWVDTDKINTDHNGVLKAINHWAEDWQSLNTPEYLSHYSPNFVGQEMSFAQWKEHKQRVNKRKKWIRLAVSDISLFKDPEEDIVIATFLQDYQSDNFSSKDYKRQYWQRQANGNWKILFENGV